MPASQAVEIASTRALRLAKEYDSEGKFHYQGILKRICSFDCIYIIGQGGDNFIFFRPVVVINRVTIDFTIGLECRHV